MNRTKLGSCCTVCTCHPIFSSMTDNNMDQVRIKLESLEKNHKARYAIDLHKTAYLCSEGETVIFSVYDNSEKTISRHGSFTLQQFSGAGTGTSMSTVPWRALQMKLVVKTASNTFLMKMSNGLIFIINGDASSHLISSIGEKLLCEVMTLHYSQRLVGLSKVRLNGDFDFTLVTKEGTIPIHSVVFKASLPFFAAMIDANMIDSREKRLEIPYPHAWVEVMVSYFYGEPFEAEFEQATGLLVLADVYDIPELRHLAVFRIKTEELDMTKCLTGWRNAFEAQNEQMREYFAAFARDQWNELEHVAEPLYGMPKQEVVEFMLDVSKAKIDKLGLND
ncbi:Conserved hypothetical protein [Yarrowia lipolytica]|nr:Conserved hypothetical protein [Yarrowia lipolytica]